MTAIRRGGSSAMHFDNIIVGAGLSGIAAGYRVQTQLPNKTYAILEGRDTVGGTWDLFRYPGIRSDSDMYTLGYSFSPWVGTKTLADGGLILDYIKKTAEKYDIRKHIHLGTKVTRMSWNSEKGQWTLDCTRSVLSGGRRTEEPVTFTCGFVFMCSGYYDYDKGYLPDFPGKDRFKGDLIHPQFWPENYDHTGKKVVVIGSGATAITLIPAMAKETAHITMLQRSPTYIAAVPQHDIMAKMLLAYLPQSMAHFVNRWRNILFANFFYQVCKLCPQLMKREIKRGVSHFLGKDYPVDEHFSPTYNPWDQRFCVAPGGDFFKAIKSGKASVETARIVSFTETGIEVERIANGEKKLLECDAIVTATGLVVKTAGGIEIVVDGEPVRRMDNRFMYKGCMVSGVPNFILSVGYTNMTFTLKVDLIGTYVTRLLAHMDKKGCKKCVPVYGNREGESPDDRGEDLIDLSAGYIQRAIGQFPRQGKRSPWRYYQNYFYDIWEFNYGRLEDGVMKIE